jgi:hypothetical protein
MVGAVVEEGIAKRAARNATVTGARASRAEVAVHRATTAQ